MLSKLRSTLLPIVLANYVIALDSSVDVNTGAVVMQERPRNQADPFEYISKNVNLMEFTGNHSFSVRLREQVKEINPSEDKRKPPVVASSHGSSYTSDFINKFMPSGSSADLAAATLVNSRDIEYVIDIWMGKAFEKMVVVPDTGSSWLSIEGKDCSTCLGTKYDYSDDMVNSVGTTDATFVITSATVEERNYGSVRTKGF
jgi:hypothetical protein